MPASMISADTGCSAYVVGSSIAIVATGPMPGSTPISVPRSEPMNAYSRFTGVNATEKPSARWFSSSIARPSEHGRQEHRPHRQLQLQAQHEDPDRQQREEQAADERLLPAKLVARRARAEDQQDRRHEQPGLLDDQAEA